MGSMGFRDLASRPLYRVYEERLLQGLDRAKLPGHIGVIHDGHRRYARSEGLPDYAASYRVGMAKFVEFLEWTEDLEIPAVTCWLLSKENLQRPSEELLPYYEVLGELFDQIPDALAGHDLGVRFIGSLDLLPAELVASAKRLEERMPDGKRRVTIALAYGGRQEIVDAVRDLVASLADEGLYGDEIVKQIDAEGIAANLYTAGLPDPDLVIRTSGEQRLSGFMLWQSAHSEFYFCEVNWPDFRHVDFLRALRSYANRQRRYGA